jgi:hypothetical protein
MDVRETTVGDEMADYKQGFIKQLISHLIDHPLSYPAYRTRIHYGHESQTFDIAFYYQGWVLQNNHVVLPKHPILHKPLCLIINKGFVARVISYLETN